MKCELCETKEATGVWSRIIPDPITIWRCDYCAKKYAYNSTKNIYCKKFGRRRGDRLKPVFR